mmetsp:Transcript_11523/g.34589  ORF Transcript_11523/g.34589 Transcript_11523/m.34589 type:complete len:267 (+) Transcript_11523:1128-1928(+)
MDGGHVIFRLSPTRMPSTPLSQPLMTSPTPNLNENVAPPFVWSKTLPDVSFPQYLIFTRLPALANFPSGAPIAIFSILRPLGNVRTPLPRGPGELVPSRRASAGLCAFVAADLAAGVFCTAAAAAAFFAAARVSFAADAAAFLAAGVLSVALPGVLSAAFAAEAAAVGCLAAGVAAFLAAEGRSRAAESAFRFLVAASAASSVSISSITTELAAAVRTPISSSLTDSYSLPSSSSLSSSSRPSKGMASGTSSSSESSSSPSLSSLS